VTARIVIAGGGTGGHIEPALAFADAVLRLAPDSKVTALGTARGLETTLIPARGYPLELIPAVSLPRRPTPALATVPTRLLGAVRAARDILTRADAQVVVGFGGYVALPAYLAARRAGIPFVVHEANARPGLANRIAARLTPHVFTASAAVPLAHATAIGIPLRRSVTTLDRAARRAGARAAFGLDPDRPTLLITGGSQGAASINAAARAAAPSLAAAGIQVLHVTGPGNDLPPNSGPGNEGSSAPYVSRAYLDGMADAYAAADFVLCRCGALTVAELSALGLPAAYVPYPHGNGEQRLNAEPIVAAGGALLVADSELTGEWIAHWLTPLMTDPLRLAAMTGAASAAGARDADEVLARAVLQIIGCPVASDHAKQNTAERAENAGKTAEMKENPVIDRPEGWTAPGAELVRSAGTEVVPDTDTLGKVHIVGIGGAGMSGLARIMLARGMTVSGSDARDSDTVAALRALGGTVFIGHAGANLGEPGSPEQPDTVIYSTAISAANPGLVEARARGVRVIRRAAALASVIAARRGIAVAGTHGKTTTTSLLTVAAQACGLDPSFAIGGNLYETGLNAHEGTGDLFIVEADESDGSFLMLAPEAAIVTNVEADHLENHGDLAGVTRAFEQFVDRIVPGGVLVVCADDPGARALGEYAASRDVRLISYGESPDADVRVTEIDERPTSVHCTVTGPGLGPIRIVLESLVGRHMALNSAGALALGHSIGMDPERVAAAFASFRGVHRRFELRGVAEGVRVYDDYAHHPTEIAATLRGARPAVGGGRLIAVFQPGTFSRTQIFAQQFAEAMELADIAVVMDVYPAREEPIPGVTGATIADLIRLPGDRLIYEPSWSATPARIAAVARPGDLVVTMGIGDVYLLCPEILSAVGHQLGLTGPEAAPAGGS
jgi:UDP-N-acetylmuramate--alanine ligase